jgi:hypothetical protein
MKKRILLFVFMSSSFNVYAQNIIPDISARIDTTQVVINKIYHLYKAYLNSKPDSVYANPCWNESEYKYYLQTDHLRIDRSANVMFYDGDAVSFYKEYKPMILQIDSIGINKYQIKTIFSMSNPSKECKGYSVPYITNLYASRNMNGKYRLENTITERTKKWKRVKYGFINYIIHPDCDFDKKEAGKAVSFCKQISKQFDIEIKPFTYYLLPNSDELGKLYNFEYWTYYVGGQTNLPLREIFATYSNINYQHELVHILFPLKKSGYTPKIISEGLATWLGGPGSGQSFEEVLKDVSMILHQCDNLSFEGIKDGSIRNRLDSNILYITGAVICKLAYEAKGKTAVWGLYNSTDGTLNSVMENIFEQPINDVGQMIIEYILRQTTK